MLAIRSGLFDGFLMDGAGCGSGGFTVGEGSGTPVEYGSVARVESKAALGGAATGLSIGGNGRIRVSSVVNRKERGVAAAAGREAGGLGRDGGGGAGAANTLRSWALGRTWV